MFFTIYVCPNFGHFHLTLPVPPEKIQAQATETLKEFLCVFGSSATEGTLFSRMTPDLGNQIYFYWNHFKLAAGNSDPPVKPPILTLQCLQRYLLVPASESFSPNSPPTAESTFPGPPSWLSRRFL